MLFFWVLFFPFGKREHFSFLLFRKIEKKNENQQKQCWYWLQGGDLRPCLDWV